MNNTDDYATFIKKNIEACADLLSDDDRAILNKDAERIAESLDGRRQLAHQKRTEIFRFAGKI